VAGLDGPSSPSSTPRPRAHHHPLILPRFHDFNEAISVLNLFLKGFAHRVPDATRAGHCHYPVIVLENRYKFGIFLKGEIPAQLLTAFIWLTTFSFYYL
jgi:hypothetical protein